jgi:hypothetical protein
MNEAIETMGAAWNSMPQWILAILTPLLGSLLAIALRFAISRLFGLVKFDRLSEKAGFTEFLRKGAIKYSPSKLIGSIAYWIVIIVTLFQTAKVLDIRIARAIAEKAIELFPSLLAAIFVAVLGFILVSFLANFVNTIVRNAGGPHARLIARAIRAVGNLVVVTLSLEQMGLGQTVLSWMFLLLFGAVAFGTALAFGLGSVDMAKQAVQRLIRNLEERERGPKGGDLEG